MSYSTSNPPQLLVPSLGGGIALWGYRSTDGSTSVVQSNYFTDGQALGMKAGDLLAYSMSTGQVAGLGVISSVSTSGATLVTGNLQTTL